MVRDVMWGHLIDPIASIAELARVFHPGGFVALAFWCSQCLLPSHPELEARLMRAWPERATYTAGVVPERHFLCALGWMPKAGIEPVGARCYSCAVCAPLSLAFRQALADTYQMFFTGFESHATSADWQQAQRLMQPDSPDFLPAHDDFCATITYVVFKGAVKAA